MDELRRIQEQFLDKIAMLERREAQWRSAIANAPTVVAMVDRNGTIQFLNRAPLGMGIEDFVGKTVYDVTLPEYRDVIQEDLRQVFEAGECRSFELVVAGPNGQHVWYDTHLGPLKMGEEVIAATVTAIDITTRKRAEEALKKAHDELERRVEERTAELTKANEELGLFRKFAEASGEGFGMSDLDGRIAYVNSTLCRMFGETSPQDVIGKQIAAYYGEGYVEKRDEMLSALMRDGYWLAEQTVLTHRGEPIQTLQSTFLIRDEAGNPFRIAVVISDITQRKQAEEALRQSEEKYRGLLEASPDAVVMADLNGKILFASRQTWSLVGITDSEELVGRQVFDYVIEEDRHRLAENMFELAKSGIRKHTEYTALRRDGGTTPTEISSTVNRDANGHPVALMAVIRDITDRKQAHETLQREHRTLKHLLQSSDHERQLIAYEIHDGLAQQLAGAIMQFQTFQYLKDAKPKEAAKAFEAGMTILQQGHFESRRLISGVRPPILDEEGVAAAIAHLVNEQSRRGEIDIEYRSRVNFDRLSPTLENTIYRVTQESLANACLHSKSQKVRVSFVQRDDRVRIEIRDWGIGFDTHSVHENRFGLEGIRQRIRLLGGKCSIRSKPGKGSRIVLELPVVARD